MRKTLLFLLIICTKLTFAQLNDNFIDGDFSANPNWGGNASSFQIVDGVLVSKGEEKSSQTIYLSTVNTLFGNVAWEFSVNLTFDPSTTNYPRIYLVANQQDLSAVAVRGYYLQLGSSSAAENFTLFRQDGTATNTSILALADKKRPSTSSVNVRVRVERTSTGRWDIYTDFSGGTNFTWDGGVTDNTYTTASYFGIYCRYATASRFNGFKFDDFKIESYTDITPPKLVSSSFIDAKTVELTFNKNLDPTTAAAAINYTMGSGKGNPISAVLSSSGTSVTLTYAANFQEGKYSIQIANLSDVKGNVVASPMQSEIIYAPYMAKKGDVVINEIMAAPSASALFAKEYVELYNTTDHYIVVNGWKLTDAANTKGFLAADTLAPKSYRVLCANADVDVYKPYGKVLGLSTWPSLNNDKDDLYLYLPDETTLIDQVSYTESWYGKAGTAVELINPTSTCGGIFNWAISTAQNSGTPGTQNSVYNANYTDNVAPKLAAVTVLNAQSIQVNFDKAITLPGLLELNNYSINNGIGKPMAVALNGNANNSVILTLAQAISVGTENLLMITNLLNCAGLQLDAKYNSAIVMITQPIAAKDVMVSEVLFNPKTGGVDFVEIYNNSNQILDLKELSISNPAITTGSGSAKKVITGTSVYVKPKTYWVITADKDDVQAKYEVKFPNQMVKIASMPAYSNESGTVSIWKDDTLIDELSYNEKMHHALLKEVKGVSLERVSFVKGGNEPGNLQSAAASVGFATPTSVNSQTEDTSVKNAISLATKTFSPDNDGFEDELKINYQFKENGNLVTINIYTDKGILVRKLARNISFSTQGTIFWDGLGDGGQLCKVGIYVVKVNTFNIKGETNAFTQTCVLASKFGK